MLLAAMAASVNPVWMEPSSAGPDGAARWVARSGKWQSALEATRFRFSSESEQVAVRFAGARSLHAPQPEGLLPGVSNYFTGRDASKWRTQVPHYSRLRYRDVYPGIDLVYYASPSGKLEYDFEVAPMADASQIRLEFEGIAKVRANGAGDLVLTTAASGQTLTHRRPVVFEERNGVRKAVPASYRVGADGVVFDFASFQRDPNAKLIIDPVVEYSTFLGGSAFDAARAIACEATDFCYLAGEGRSLTGLVGPLQSSGNGGQEVIVVKINHQTNTVVYYAVIGGDLDETANAIVIDSTGAAYVAGTTKSQNFPTRNAAQPNPGGALLNDAFVLKLGPAGANLVYSTYIGGTGSDEGRGLAVDRNGAAYVVGSTGSRENFPVTPGAFQTSFRGTILQQSTTGFVAKVNPAGNQFVYSTFFGGSRQDDVRAVAVDDGGNAILAGTTTSLDFPVRNATYGLLASAISGFVAKLNPEGTQPLFASYFGGPANNSVDALATNAAGDVYIGGWTNAAGFPVKNAAQADYGGGTNDGFVAKFNAGIYDLAWSTYLGGSASDRVTALALQSDGSVTAGGQTASRNFPQYNSPFLPSPKTDAFATRIAPGGNRMVSSMLIGGAEDEAVAGVAVTGNDSVILTGSTVSKDFPLRGGGQQSTFGGGTADMFLVRLVPDQAGPSLTPSLLAASASSVSFVATTGDIKPPAAASIQITSPTGSNIGFLVEWAVTGGGSWLSAGPQRAETPATLNVFANPATMAPGTYLGTVRLIPVSGGEATTINVRFQVLNPRAVVTGIFPSWIAPGSPDTEVEIQGKAFAQGATVRMTSEDANGAQVLTPVRQTANSIVFSAAKAFLFRDTSFELRVHNPDAESSNPISFLVEWAVTGGGSWLSAGPQRAETPATLN
ncbi:MAG: SBBP repeat-containing protein, partial [Acidobacteria bacterium]|nr:SBBP repeat-containing protein [Acidobacteriota bacterium]